MLYKDLGQIAGIVYSSSAPVNETILWRDTSTNTTKYYDNQLLSWVQINVVNAGQVAVNIGDTPDYLANKIDSTLRVVGDKIGVTTSTTPSEKEAWNAKIRSYFVETYTDRDSLLGLNNGDRVFVMDSDGNGKKESWTYYNNSFFKDFDPNWENSGSVSWGDIIQGDVNVNRVITDRVGFAESGKIMSAEELGVGYVYTANYNALNYSIDLPNECEVICFIDTPPVDFTIISDIRINGISAAEKIGKKYTIVMGLFNISLNDTFVVKNATVPTTPFSFLSGCVYTIVSLGTSTPYDQYAITACIQSLNRVNNNVSTIATTTAQMVTDDRFVQSEYTPVPNAVIPGLYYIKDRYHCTLIGHNMTNPSLDFANLGTMPSDLLPIGRITAMCPAYTLEGVGKPPVWLVFNANGSILVDSDPSTTFDVYIFYSIKKEISS